MFDYLLELVYTHKANEGEDLDTAVKNTIEAEVRRWFTNENVLQFFKSDEPYNVAQAREMKRGNDKSLALKSHDLQFRVTDSQ